VADVVVVVIRVWVMAVVITPIMAIKVLGTALQVAELAGCQMVQMPELIALCLRTVL
jgi:hypothetical protein